MLILEIVLLLSALSNQVYSKDQALLPLSLLQTLDNKVGQTYLASLVQPLGLPSSRPPAAWWLHKQIWAKTLVTRLLPPLYEQTQMSLPSLDQLLGLFLLNQILLVTGLLAAALFGKTLVMKLL